MKQNTKDFCVQLLKDCTSKNGLLNFLNNVEVFNSNIHDGLSETVCVPVTLRRMELLVFIESKLKSAVENEQFIEVNNFLIVKQFYLSENVQIVKFVSGFSLILPPFFKDNLIFLLSLLNEFEAIQIVDKESDLVLNYNEKELIKLLPVLTLFKKDEILWGWNIDQLKINDWILLIKNGKILELESNLLNEGIDHLNLILRKGGARINSQVFIIIEGMAYHEEEMKTFVEELKNNIPDCNFKIAIKEVAELEPIAHFIYTKN